MPPASRSLLLMVARASRPCLSFFLLLLAAPALAQPAPAPPRSAVTRDAANRRDWTLHAEVRLHPAQPRVIDPRDVAPTPLFLLESVEMVWALPPASAMHDAFLTRIKSEFRIDNRVVDSKPRIEHGYQSLSDLAVWAAANVESRDIALILDVPMTCYETRIDEKLARQYTWPSHPWSPELALCLQPQLFVEASDAEVQRLARLWAGDDPRAGRLLPYDLAKHLAAQVINHLQPDEGASVSVPRGPLTGPNFTVNFRSPRVNGAAFAARERRGSPFDLPCLLTGVYRAAGIPARLVIGIDIKRTDELRSTTFRAWTEFFLARDPATIPARGGAPGEPPAPITPTDGEWIPVDIMRQKEFSSRAPPLNQRWEFFGRNEEFDFVAPIAFHWIPPRDIVTVGGGPGFWGWNPRPANPEADQEIRFWTYETPKRGDDPPEFRKR